MKAPRNTEATREIENRLVSAAAVFSDLISEKLMARLSFQGSRLIRMQKLQFEIGDRKWKSLGIVHYGEEIRCVRREKSRQDAGATSAVRCEAPAI
jgi:hypothetical protein